MTYPRIHLVDATNGGVYHCISRCVRRAWLCGADPLTGRSFEHRKHWVESRILELSALFAIDLYGYAVMSNHYHLVLKVDPARARQWSDEEVVRRWCALAPGKSAAEAEKTAAVGLLTPPERLAVLRERLGSLSWFMRYLNEPLARSANREDGVTGRFWEGRFKSIALLDDAAVISCMAYVDLNPVRAKLCQDIEGAAHTAIHRRLANPRDKGTPLVSLGTLGLTLERYRALLEWTVSVERGRVAPPVGQASAALSHIGQRPDAWLGRVKVHRFKYRAYGALGLLHDYAASLGQRWLHGARAGCAAPG